MKKAIKILFFAVMPGILLGAADEQAPLVFSGTCMARFWADALPPRHEKLYKITRDSISTGLAQVPREARKAWIERFCIIQKKDLFDIHNLFTNEEFFCLCYVLAHLYDTPDEYGSDEHAFKKYGKHSQVFCDDWMAINSFIGLSVKLPSTTILKKLWHPRFFEGASTALRALIKRILGDYVEVVVEGGLVPEYSKIVLLLQGDFQLGRHQTVYRISALFDEYGEKRLICQSYSGGDWELCELLESLLAPFFEY